MKPDISKMEPAERLSGFSLADTTCPVCGIDVEFAEPFQLVTKDDDFYRCHDKCFSAHPDGLHWCGYADILRGKHDTV